VTMWWIEPRIAAATWTGTTGWASSSFRPQPPIMAAKAAPAQRDVPRDLRVHDFEDRDLSGLVTKKRQPQAVGGEVERRAERVDLCARGLRFGVESGDVGEQWAARQRQVRFRLPPPQLRLAQFALH